MEIDYYTIIGRTLRNGAAITPNMVIEVAYTGSGARTPGSMNLGYLPEQYWSKGNVRDNDRLNYLQTNFPNPFHVLKLTSLQTSNPALYRFLTTVGGRFNTTTIQRQQLLRAYPSLTSLNGIPPVAGLRDFDNRNRYHDLQIQLDKRYSKGLRTVASYTRSYGRTTFRANEFDQEYSWQENTATWPHRISWTAIYELPFGRGRRWETPATLRYIVGGWQVSWVNQFQSGTPLGFDNRFFYGDVNKIGELLKHDEVREKDIHAWFEPNIAYRTGSGAIPANFVGFEGRTAMQPTPYTGRVFPNQITALKVRRSVHTGWPSEAGVAIRESTKFSFSMDMFNVTNHTNFGGPNTDPTSTNFGRVTGQNGAGRQMQVNLRLDF